MMFYFYSRGMQFQFRPLIQDSFSGIQSLPTISIVLLNWFSYAQVDGIW